MLSSLLAGLEAGKLRPYMCLGDGQSVYEIQPPVGARLAAANA